MVHAELCGEGGVAEVRGWEEVDGGGYWEGGE